MMSTHASTSYRKRRERRRFPRESRLDPQDIENALGSMKQRLALTELRRQLMDPDLDAITVLGLTRRILEIQRRG